MNSAQPRFSNRALALASFAIVAAAMLLILASAELTARYLEPKPAARASIFQPHSALGWLPKPGHFTVAAPEFSFDATINALNMNDREIGAADLALSQRILVLGDSHTFAVGAPTSGAWPKRLEARLFPEPRNGAVWNSGVAGYSLGQYLVRFRGLQPKLHANLILVGFSMATDLYDLIPPERGGFVYGGNAERVYFDLGANGELIERNFRRQPTNGVTPAAAPVQSWDMSLSIRKYLKNLALYRWLKRSKLAMWIAVHYRPGGRSLWPGLDTALKKNLSEDDRYRWTLAERLLEKLVKEAEATGAKTVVVNIPYLAQVYDEVWAWSFGSKPDEYDRWIAGKRLAELCRRIGADYIDTTEAFVAAARARQHWLHWPQDAHPTPEGHDLIAETVAGGLVKAGIVPAR